MVNYNVLQKYRRNCDILHDNYARSDGFRVLHLAVLHNLPNLVDIICNLGLWVQVNARNSLFQTPLHLAVLTSNLRSALTLLSAKSSVDVQDYRGNTPLHLACLHGDIDLVVAMIEGNLCAEYIVINCSSDYKIGKISKLHKEILHSLNAKCLQRSYPKTFDVSASENVRAFRDNPALHIRNYDGLMCLHLAVIYACADLVSLLLSKGADVNAKVSVHKFSCFSFHCFLVLFIIDNSLQYDCFIIIYCKIKTFMKLPVYLLLLLHRSAMTCLVITLIHCLLYVLLNIYYINLCDSTLLKL